MKKKSILNLIKYYSENNDIAFKNQSYEIAKYFDMNGDSDLAQYIMAILSNKNTFVPQEMDEDLKFIRRIKISNNHLFLPNSIKNDILGISNAIKSGSGLNKYLFQGKPGTGKTESVKQLARILNRNLYIVDFDQMISSLMGETSKNINNLFEEINNIEFPQKTIVLFDEIDEIALSRINNSDIREMGRATTSVIRGLDDVNKDVVIIATTNLYNNFDKALIRRFNSIIDFNKYNREDLSEISNIILKNELLKYPNLGKNTRLFNKILDNSKVLPYPGDLKNIIETSLAFSSNQEKYDYFKRLYTNFIGNNNKDINMLKNDGFTLREMEIISGISKSKISRKLRMENE